MLKRKSESKLEKSAKRSRKLRITSQALPSDLNDLMKKVVPESKEEKRHEICALGTKQAPLTLKLSKELEVALAMARSALGSHIYRIDIGYAYNIVTNGSGFLNTGSPNSNLSSLTEFTSFAGLFSEFFILAQVGHYSPYSRYNIPGGNTQPSGGSTYTQIQSTATGLVSLFHDQASHTNVNTMVTSPTFKLVNTGDPWDCVWINNENPSSDVVTSSSGTAVATQSWCSTATTPAGAYTGTIQILGSQSLPMSVSCTVGLLAVKWHILWRNRA